MNRKHKTLFISWLLSIVMTISLVIGMVMPALAEDKAPSTDKEIAYQTTNTAKTNEDDGNVTYAIDVSAKMCDASYWKSRSLGDKDRVLMTLDEISALNAKILSTEKALMYDLEKIEETCNPDSISESLSTGSVPADTIYVNGELLEDKEAYYSAIYTAIKNTGYKGTSGTIKYAIGTKRTNLKHIPTNDFIGYSDDDTDDEIVLSSVSVNEPIIIKQKCVINGHTFYWGYTNNCVGWVDGDDIAFCSSREEWLNAWKINPKNKDFVVVTQDKIVLEPSIYAAYSSEVKLTLGTILKLVPSDMVPTSVAERYSYNNYVVYLPVRNDDGSYRQEMALISQHLSLSTGFLPLTQSNILDVAFCCLGNRYGWGGMLDSMDCSCFTRTIYECFGLELPRNTTTQRLVPGTFIDISSMTDEEKEQLIETTPAGTLLYFSGHCMCYIGSENGKNYQISATGMFYENEAELRSTQSIVITPLTVKRGNGRTWLNNLETIVLPAGLTDLSDCTVDVSKDKSTGKIVTQVKSGDVTLVENVNYTLVSSTDNKTGIVTVTATGKNNYTGTAVGSYNPNTPCKEHTVVKDAAVKATCTVSGLTEGSHCSVCGTVITAQTTIPATGHSWNDKYTVDKQATSTQNGLMSIHCKNCDATKNATIIPATGGGGGNKNPGGSGSKDSDSKNSGSTDKNGSKTKDTSSDKDAKTQGLIPNEKKSANEASGSNTDKKNSDKDKDSKDSNSSNKNDSDKNGSDKNNKEKADGSANDRNSSTRSAADAPLYLWVALTASVILNIIFGIILINNGVKKKRKNVYNPDDYR